MENIMCANPVRKYAMNIEERQKRFMKQNKMNIQIKPLSTNKAWMGRKFKSDDYIDFELELSVKLKKFKDYKMDLDKTELEVSYTFYLKNYALTDVGNLEKQLTDVLVANQFIKDDRYIKRLILQKERSEGDDFIEIQIKKYEQ
jgi:Holliday junction resolvase RusA-like endonuclease